MNGRTLGLALAIALAFLAWSGGMVAWGRHIEGQAAALRESQASEKATQDLLEANGRVRMAYGHLQQVLDDTDKHYEEERSHAQADHDRFVAGLWAGSTRVSIPVVAQTCPAGATADPSSAGQPQEARAQLEPAAAAALAAIVNDGNDAVIDLNQCIDRYNEARSAIARLIEASRK